jgi:DNA-binding NarL/FixJ family response regulator
MAVEEAVVPSGARWTGQARILIVDDDEAVRDMLHDVLESDARFAVAGDAEDGAAAVEAARRLRPDVVVIDQQMPRMTGLEALPALRRRLPDAVLVMFSGTPEPCLEERAAAAGADAFVLKRTRPRLLLGLIGDLLDERAAAR